MNNLFPRSRFSCFYVIKIYKSHHINISTSHHINISTSHHLTISPSHHITISPPHHINTSPHQCINAVASMLSNDDNLVATEHLAWALHLCARSYAVDGCRFGHDEAH